jgi:hypothetical protein
MRAAQPTGQAARPKSDLVVEPTLRLICGGSVINVLTRRTKARLTGLSGLVAAALLALVSAGPAGAAVSGSPLATPTFNASVYAVAVRGDVVYVGGNFTAAVVKGKQVARQRLAAISLSTGTLLDWAPAADKVVRAIAVAGEHVWAGGDFQTVNGQTRDSLVKVSATGTGAVDPAQYRIAGGTPRALGVGHGRLYLAGLFTGVNGVSRSNVAAIDLASGTLSSWAPRTDDLVTSLAVTTNRVYLAGSFHKTNGISSTGRLIAVKPDGAAVDLGFRPQPDAIVHAVAVTSDRVYGALGGQGGRLISYTTGGKAEWTLTTDGDAQAVAVLGSTVYLGGHFDNVCRSARTGDHGVCIDGSLSRIKFAATDLSGDLLSWAPMGNGIRGVLALTASTDAGVVAAGGEFTTIDGVAQKRFAVFD